MRLTSSHALLSVVVALAGLLSACGASPGPSSARPRAGDGPCAPGDEVTLAADLSARCLVEGVWVFTALSPADHAFPAYPANGLVVESGDQAALIDTGWVPEHAEALAHWAAEVRHRPITAALVTHFHDDRVGGAPALNARAIPVYALNETAERAAERGTPFVHRALEPGSIPSVRWMYPGRGHAPENIVVRVEGADVLFGGCFIKELAASSLGNLADADVEAWRASIDLVMASFPTVLHVVPGHGAPGGPELLTHTRELLRPTDCSLDADCTVSIEVFEPCACCGCAEPRAVSLAAIEAARASRLSCEPSCEDMVEGSCPACTPPEVLATLRAQCVERACVLRP